MGYCHLYIFYPVAEEDSIVRGTDLDKGRHNINTLALTILLRYLIASWLPKATQLPKETQSRGVPPEKYENLNGLRLHSRPFWDGFQPPKIMNLFISNYNFTQIYMQL